MKLTRGVLALAMTVACSQTPNSTITKPDTTSKTTTTTTTADPNERTTTTAAGDVQLVYAVQPKPLTGSVERGLAWLVQHQLANGGWGQGDFRPAHRMNGRGYPAKDMPMARKYRRPANLEKANVADTAMAVLALMRAGNTASTGAHHGAVAKGINYILSEVEASDDSSLYVTSMRGTRVQSKIGTYVDTFTALTTLTDAKGTMPDAAGNQRVDAALKKIIAKIERNQGQNGQWGNQGWAPVLTQSLAAKGLNNAERRGFDVDDKVLARTEAASKKSFRGGRFAAEGSAGITLYSGAAQGGAMKDANRTWRKKAKIAREKLAAKTDLSPSDRERYQTDLKSAEDNEAQTKAMQDALVTRLSQPRYIQGFGNNGGEEYLSYMLVSEQLVIDGGKRWKNWDQQITSLVNKVQNEDGSWVGHHCITGRTFNTSAALLVLMGDRLKIDSSEKQLASAP